MSEFLWKTYHRLIAELDVPKHRFLYPQLDTDHRLLGIVGPRGVGKTTMLLQFIKEKLYDDGHVFYFSADNSYFNQHSLLEFVDHLYQMNSITTFFIDEIHKYPGWNQELKNIYDAFPAIKVRFSGSSSIDLIKGSYDLSRRAQLLHLPGLSFREYLNIKLQFDLPAISFDELLGHHQQYAQKITKHGAIASYFKEYKDSGYYPMVFEAAIDLESSIINVVDKTIFEDISLFYKLKTTSLNHLRKITSFLASIPPGNISINNIAKHLSVDFKTADNYVDILQRTGLIKLLYPVAHGNQVLTKAAKIFLDNTTLLQAMNTILSEPLNVGTQRELAFLQFTQGAGLQVFHPKQGDFQIKDTIFEVGGKNKTGSQLKSSEMRKYIVKDDVAMGTNEVIPLYLFGFLY